MPSGLGGEVCKGKPANQPPQEKCHVEVSWVPLGSPRGVPELCWLSWAALGCCWLLLVAPQPSHQRAPESNPTMTTNMGQLSLKTAIHSEFSKQPGVYHQMRLT